MKFVRDQFNISGEYLSYGADRRFVARFRYGRNGKAGSFITFLIKNFDVEEYFTALDGGMSPLPILESKGYMSPNAKKACRHGGFPVTPEGFKQYIESLTAQFKPVTV